MSNRSRTGDEDTIQSDSDMVCEAHPLRVWPHDECPGPGMPYQAGLAWIRTQCERYQDKAGTKVLDEYFLVLVSAEGTENPEAAQETAQG